MVTGRLLRGGQGRAPWGIAHCTRQGAQFEGAAGCYPIGCGACSAFLGFWVGNCRGRAVLHKQGPVRQPPWACQLSRQEETGAESGSVQAGPWVCLAYGGTDSAVGPEADGLGAVVQ